MKTFALLSLFFGMLACTNKECCTVVDMDININYANGKGEDLFNPNTESHFVKSDIEVSYPNEKKKNANTASSVALDNPDGFRIDTSTTTNGKRQYWLKLFLSTPPGEIKTAHLQLSKNDTDTITYTLSNNDKVIDKVWYNGRSPENMKSGRSFKIIK